MTCRTPDDVQQAAAEGDAVDLDQRLAAVRRPLRHGQALYAEPVAQPAGLHLGDVHPRCATGPLVMSARDLVHEVQAQAQRDAQGSS